MRRIWINQPRWQNKPRHSQDIHSANKARLNRRIFLTVTFNKTRSIARARPHYIQSLLSTYIRAHYFRNYYYYYYHILIRKKKNSLHIFIRFLILFNIIFLYTFTLSVYFYITILIHNLFIFFFIIYYPRRYYY